MPILDRNNAEEMKRYKDFIEHHLNRSLLQDPAWTEVKDDWGSEFVYLEDEDGKIIAGMTILIRTIKGGFSLLYASRGPVSDFEDIEVTKRLIAECEPIAKKYKAFALRMDPEVPYTKDLSDRYQQAGFSVRNEGYDFDDLIQPRMNIILYLDGYDEESIMSRFKGTTRTAIRKAEREGVYTTWARSDEYIDKFFEIHTFMAQRNEITHRSIQYFYGLRDALSDRLRVYLVHHEDDILAASITINYFGKMYYLYAGSNDTKRSLMPNQKMIYDTLKWGFEEGATQFDFGGVKALDNSDGLYQFKKHFAYKDEPAVYIGEVDHVYKPFLYTLFTKGVPMLRKWRKTFRRD